MKIELEESLRNYKKINKLRFLQRGKLREDYEEIIIEIIRKQKKSEKEKKIWKYSMKMMKLEN